jgi:gamma-glutamyltranspeptidase/glutathione hydrolase
VAPAGATVAHYRGLGLDLVPGTGPLAAAVPGAFDAWLLLLRDHGTKSLDDVLKYAIGYAEHGHAPVEKLGATVESVRELFETEWTSSAEVYLPGGRAPRPGELLRNPALAATWRRLLAETARAGDREARIDAAREVWRSGFIAEALVRQAHRPTVDTSGERHTGTLTAADLAGWSATYETPVTYDWNGWTVCKAGPWSQGPALLQQLALLPPELPAYGSAEYVHLLIEGCKLAMADREAWYGDAADVPLTDLLDADYAARRRVMIGERAADGLTPGDPGGRHPKLAGLVATAPLRAEADVTTAEPVASQIRGDTCSVAVADRYGNLIAATPSGGWLQSSPVIGELGFPLGTRLQMTWLEPGLPSSLQPGTRPRTTLSPTFVVGEDGTMLACCTPGGDDQDQWQLGFLLNHLLRGEDLQQAIDAPAFHTEHFPSSFYPRESRPRRVVLESRFGDATAAELRRRGHDVAVSEAWSQGRLCAVGRSPDGRLRAAANPRGMQGYAVGR